MIRNEKYNFLQFTESSSVESSNSSTCEWDLMNKNNTLSVQMSEDLLKTVSLCSHPSYSEDM